MTAVTMTTPMLPCRTPRNPLLLTSHAKLPGDDREQQQQAARRQVEATDEDDD
jgi:hypothetical protein